MKEFLIVTILVFAANCATFGQSQLAVLERLQEIKLLESDRHDVKRLLADFEATDDEGHNQEFSQGDISVEVSYSSGTCPDDDDDEEAELFWKVAEWKVTSIKITSTNPFTPESIDLDLKGFMKEQAFANVPDEFIQHNKRLGLALRIDEDGIREIIIFPPKGNEKRLCGGNAFAKKFYELDSWFGDSKLKDRTIIECYAASVTALDLSATKLLATSNKTISVTTTAIDPENDVLTYMYTVSAGQIRGTGAKVVWDLTGVAPGTYTITAGVDDGCGICGKTETKSVVIE